MAEKADETNLKIGIMGCGAIGSGIAIALQQGLHSRAELSAVYDIDPQKVKTLSQKCDNPNIAVSSLNALIEKTDLIVEAVNADQTADLLLQIIDHGNDILVMSVGKLLINPRVMAHARKTNVNILVPSGAIAGIDALKGAMIAGIDKISITTYKPPKGLSGAPFIEEKGIVLEDIKDESTIFEGSVKDAIKAFPRNINVAATLALATDTIDNLRTRIVTSPNFTHNRHEIIAKGAFGEIKTETKNIPSPDNPKTSYLSILSAMATLKTFCDRIKVGT